MSKPGKSRPRLQRGDILIEALVGVLLAGIIGGGMAHLAARVLDNQRQARLMQLAIDGMEQRLVINGLDLCNEAPGLLLPSGRTAAIAIDCSAASQLEVGIGGNGYPVMPPPRISLAIAASALELHGDTPVTLGSQQ